MYREALGPGEGGAVRRQCPGRLPGKGYARHAAPEMCLLPTPGRVAAGELSGLLLDPRSLGDYDAAGTGLGRALMLGASWDGYKRLTPDVQARATLCERRPGPWPPLTALTAQTASCFSIAES